MNLTSNSDKGIFWIHFVKALAIIMVVFIHAGGGPLYAYGSVPMNEWWISNVYVSLSRVGVAYFFMVSGVLLLERNETLKDFFLHRLSKLIVPLLFWSVFYIFWRIWFYKPAIDFSTTLGRLLETPSFPHLWFLYTMIGVYLTYPVLRPFIQFGSTQVHWYFVLVWLFMLIFLPTIPNRLGFTLNSDLTQNLVLFSGYVGYPVTGYLLGKILRNNRLVAAMIPVAIISPLATILWTYIYTQSSGKVDVSSQYYLGPTIIFTAISSFYLIRMVIEAVESRIPSILVASVINISKASYGIYLVHIVFIDLLASGKLGFHLSSFTAYPLLIIPLVTVITLFFSYLTVVFIHKIPFAKMVLP